MSKLKYCLLIPLLAAGGSHAYELYGDYDGVAAWPYSLYKAGAYASINPVEGTEAIHGTPGSGATASASFGPYQMTAYGSASPGSVKARASTGDSDYSFHADASSLWLSGYSVRGSDGRMLSLSFVGGLTGSYDATTSLTTGIAAAAMSWSIGSYPWVAGQSGSSSVFVVGGYPIFESSGDQRSTTMASLKVCAEATVAGVHASLPCLTLATNAADLQSAFSSISADLEAEVIDIGFDKSRGDDISIKSIDVGWNTKVSATFDVATEGLISMGVGVNASAFRGASAYSDFGSTFKLDQILVDQAQVQGLGPLYLEFVDGSVMPITVAAVPEPASIAMAAIGAACLLPLRRRKSPRLRWGQRIEGRSAHR